MDHNKSRIANGNLTLVAAAVSNKPAAKEKSIYCVKGKTKRITESGKCPKGWKAKKA
jgi:hypothetical protein